jgi:hypothetical protein
MGRVDSVVAIVERSEDGSEDRSDVWDVRTVEVRGGLRILCPTIE